MLCLRCWNWWPAGSRYCGVCQRSLNARVCPEGHNNPLWGPQLTCNTCNQPLLHPGTLGLPMGWIAKGLYLFVFLGVGWQVVLHLNWILSRMWQTTIWLLCQGLCHIPPAFYRLVENLIVWWISLYLLSHLLPKEFGGPFRGWLVRIVQIGFRLAGSLLMLFGKGVVGLFRLAAHKDRHKTLKRGRKGSKREHDEGQGAERRH